MIRFYFVFITPKPKKTRKHVEDRDYHLLEPLNHLLALAEQKEDTPNVSASVNEYGSKQN